MTDSQRTVLVTGAAGFIGSHASEAFLARGDRVIGVDNFDPFYDASFKRANLEEVRRHPHADRFEFVESDIRDGDEMLALFERTKPTTVLHLAARAGVRPSIKEPALYAQVNVHATVHLLEAAQRTGVRRFLLASSSSVYGNNPKTPFSETDDVSGPISPYAATKRACELIAHTYHHLYKTPIACLRFFTVYGPRQRPDLAIMKFMRLMAAGETIPMFGDGSMARDFTYVDDIVKGVLAADDAIEQHGLRIWNLGGNRPVALRDMIATIGRVLGVEPNIDRLPDQPGEVRITYADLTRSAADLGYAPSTTFEEGVRKQWEWAKAHRG
ncbi:MAG: NAD-dependent epimerase/dehydratase family protein [Phycisphaerales bacterium]|nr:MAG: NAD-dependent epimerase/dehydratase family protein [Phycisphaerales bacterium]